MALRLFAALASLALAGAGAAAAEPLFRCPRDHNLSQCTGQAFVNIMKKFGTGDPEHGIHKVDPLTIPRMVMDKQADEVLNVNMSFINLEVSGISRGVTLKSAGFDWDKLQMTLVLERPNLDFKGMYKLHGKVMWLPIWGQGQVTMKMSKGVTETFHLSGERRQNEQGETYWHLTNYMISFMPNFMHVNYDNLFGGNSLLGYGANTLLNAQWKTIYNTLRTLSDKQYSLSMRPHWAEILRHIPLDEAFPAATAAAAL